MNEENKHQIPVALRLECQDRQAPIQKGSHIELERARALVDKWRAVLDNPAPYKTTMILEGQETFIPKIEDSE